MITLSHFTHYITATADVFFSLPWVHVGLDFSLQKKNLTGSAIQNNSING